MMSKKNIYTFYILKVKKIYRFDNKTNLYIIRPEYFKQYEILDFNRIKQFKTIIEFSGTIGYNAIDDEGNFIGLIEKI